MFPGTRTQYIAMMRAKKKGEHPQHPLTQTYLAFFNTAEPEEAVQEARHEELVDLTTSEHQTTREVIVKDVGDLLDKKLQQYFGKPSLEGETAQEARARLKATRKLEDVALKNLEAQRKDEERQAKRQRAGAKAKGKAAANLMHMEH